MFRFFIVLIVLLQGAFRPADPPGGGLDDIIRALQTGRAADIGPFFDETVDLTLAGRSEGYGRAQATAVLRHFFSNNAVTGFDVQYRGGNGASEYCVGRLFTRSGTYRAAIYLRHRDGRSLVRELQFVAL